MEDARFRDIMAQVKAGDVAAMDSLLVASFSPLRAAIVHQMSDSLKKAQLAK